MGRIDLHITEEIKQNVLANCKAGKYTTFGNYTIEKVEDLDGFKFHLKNNDVSHSEASADKGVSHSEASADKGVSHSEASAKEWVMIRASGTEPVLRVYSESSSQDKAEAILQACKNTILA
jgi:phosphomannomutase